MTDVDRGSDGTYGISLEARLLAAGCLLLL
eukprot:SAG31_NODE_44623_length_262_cov_0.631902_1_plen_29_part_01